MDENSPENSLVGLCGNTAAAGPSIKRDWLYYAVPCVLLAAVLVIGMIVSFPSYDDSLLHQLLTEYGPRSLYEGHGDRPIYGFTLYALAQVGLLWPVFTVTNALGWLAVGGVAAWLFQFFFPGERKLALGAALISIAPMLVETQFTIASSLIQFNALCHLNAVLLLPVYSSRRTRLSALLVAACFAAIGVMYSEYGLATTLAVIALLTARAIATCDRHERKQHLVSIGLLLLVAMAAFAVFKSVADPTLRPGTTSSYLTHEGIYRFVKMPFRLLSAFWAASFGSFATETGAMNVETPARIGGLLFAMPLAVVAALCARRIGPKEGDRAFRINSWAVLSLATAMIVGILPFMVMGRRLNDFDMNSRFFVPALPMASCVTVMLIAQIARAWPKTIVVGAIGLVAGYATMSKTLIQWHDQQTIRAWSKIIEPYLDPNGLTIAVLPSNAPTLRWGGADDELTVRLSMHWPLEKQKKFWATPSFWTLGPWSSSMFRGAKREGPVTKVLLVTPEYFGLRIVQIPVESAKDNQLIPW
jgi:hypothetical protein